MKELLTGYYLVRPGKQKRCPFESIKGDKWAYSAAFE